MGLSKIALKYALAKMTCRRGGGLRKEPEMKLSQQRHVQKKKCRGGMLPRGPFLCRQIDGGGAHLTEYYGEGKKQREKSLGGVAFPSHNARPQGYLDHPDLLRVVALIVPLPLPPQAQLVVRVDGGGTQGPPRCGESGLQRARNVWLAGATCPPEPLHC